MTRTLLKYKVPTALFSGALVLVHILWEYFHGGVTSHHLLAREELPAISNWWGLLTIPLLTWATLSRIQGRFKKGGAGSGHADAIVAGGFFGGLVLGLSLALLWEFGLVHYMSYVLLFPLVLALVFPVYRAECLLGFVLGMVYTFGGVLPILIGGVLTLLGLFIQKVLVSGISRVLG